MTIPDRTPEELKTIAADLAAGRIFADRHLGEEDWHLFPSVFMPFAFMDQAQRQAFVEAKPGMVFEYLDKAGPRSINGYPAFFSMQVLSEEQTAEVFRLMAAIREAVEAVS